MNTKDEFRIKGFLVVNGLIDNPDKLYKYTLDNIKNGDFNDPQIPNTPSFYNDKKMQKIQKILKPKIEKLTGIKLDTTYNYYRTYKKGDILRMHRDRPACEISLTLNLGFKGKPWPIWITDYDETPYKVMLKPGDAIIYHGCDLWHWRGVNTTAELYSQVFMHYVDKSGPFTKYAGDTNW